MWLVGSDAPVRNPAKRSRLKLVMQGTFCEFIVVKAGRHAIRRAKPLTDEGPSTEPTLSSAPKQTGICVNLNLFQDHQLHSVTFISDQDALWSWSG